MSFLMKRIEDEYIKYAVKWGENTKLLPFGTIPTGNGGFHIELSNNGKIALVATDRNVETSRQETYSVDEILYWMFSLRARARGRSFELKNRHPTDDSRRLAFSKALEEIGKLNPEWQERMKNEQEEILRRHPFKDGSNV